MRGNLLPWYRARHGNDDALFAPPTNVGTTNLVFCQGSNAVWAIVCREISEIRHQRSDDGKALENRGGLTSVVCHLHGLNPLVIYHIMVDRVLVQAGANTSRVTTAGLLLQARRPPARTRGPSGEFIPQLRPRNELVPLYELPPSCTSVLSRLK